MTLNEFWRHVEKHSRQKEVTFDTYRVLVHITLHCRRDEGGTFSTYVSVGRLTESLGWNSLSRVERQLDKLKAAGFIERTPVPHNKCGKIDGIVLVVPTKETVTTAQDEDTAPEVEPQQVGKAEVDEEESADPGWNDLKDLGWTRDEVELLMLAGAHLPPWQAVRQIRGVRATTARRRTWPRRSGS